MPFRTIPSRPSQLHDAAVPAFLSSLDAAINRIISWHKEHNLLLHDKDIQDFYDNIVSSLCHPDPSWTATESLGFGAFKECYEGLGAWIIKFASDTNYTSIEKQILEAAAREDVSELFLESIYIDMPFPMQSTLLDEEDNYSCVRESVERDASCPTTYCTDCPYHTRLSQTMLTTIVLQPMVSICENESHEPHVFDREIYLKKNQLYDASGNDVAFREYSTFYDAPHNWISDLAAMSKTATWQTYVEFVQKYRLNDLRAANVGYLTISGVRRPVIVDWTSWNPSGNEPKLL